MHKNEASCSVMHRLDGLEHICKKFSLEHSLKCDLSLSSNFIARAAVLMVKRSRKGLQKAQKEIGFGATGVDVTGILVYFSAAQPVLKSV